MSMRQRPGGSRPDRVGMPGREREDRMTRRRGTPAWAVLVAAALMAAPAIPPGTRVLAGEEAERPGTATPKPRPTAAPPASPSPAPAPAAPDPAVPLHERIDRLLEAALARELPGQVPAAPATDGEFVRRAWLDLAGMIPTAAEARAFLDDPSPYKRAALIDRLLEAPTFARRMQQVFDVMLMERRDDLYVPAGLWRAFLYRAFAEGRPYDELVRQILAADGSDPATRPAARFLLNREGDPNLLTRDIGRLFLGMDLQCCQCHDHPLIDGYTQQQYYGLYAFLNRTVVIGGKAADGTIVPGSVAVLGEKAEGDVTFTSVFKKKVTHKTGPRVLEGKPADEPSVPKGQEYLVPPDKEGKVRPVPVVSRRALLGPSLASPGSPAFARNIVNRLWALVMGRGLVHPVDLHHDANPPSHPELLDLLATQFVAMRYDIRAFLREVALTRAYQRSSEAPPDSSPELAEPRRFAVAVVRPTSPEQLAWSVMQAVGYLAAARAEAERQLDGIDPRMKAILDQDAPRRALRAATVEERVYERLAPHVVTFVRHFGGVAGQTQEGAEATSTVDQALFITNGEPIKGWLMNPAPGWLIARLAAPTDTSAVAEELYLSLLSRRPTADERSEVADYLTRRASASASNPEKLTALRELTWGLLASTEFRFNH